MILVSHNVQNRIKFPGNAVIRVNAAWVQTEQELNEILCGNIGRVVYLDYPEGRTKPPKPTIPLSTVLKAAHNHENVYYFAVSNAESEMAMEQLRAQLPSRVKIIPKIETPLGVLNVLAVVRGAYTDTIMLDKEDLYTAVNKDSKQFTDYLDILRETCKKNRIEVLELQGVVFYAK